MSDVKKLLGYDIKDAYARSEIAQMKVNFQDGVDTIYNAIVAQGITPSSSTPSDCATAISQLNYQNGYNAGRSQGRKDIGENAQLIINDTLLGSTKATISNLTTNHYYIITVLCHKGSAPVTNIKSGADLIVKSYAKLTWESRYIGATVLFVKATSNAIVVESPAVSNQYGAVIDLGASQ